MRVDADNWLDAQNSVLGAALIEPKVVPLVLSSLNEADFSGPCRTVFAAMTEVFNSGFPVDVVSVAAKLGPDYRKFLADLMQITPTAANVEHHIALCRERAQVLACRDIGRQLMACESSDAVRELVEQASGLISSAQNKRTMSMSDSLARFFERPEQKIRYLGWPVADLENYLHVGSGKFVILGAEPSVGKTAFALQCAWHWAGSGKVGFFSFETDPETLFDRLISGYVGIPMQNIKTNRITQKEWDLICQASQEIAKRKLDLISAAGMNPSDIRAKIMEAGYKVIVVDYLQIVSFKGSSRYEQVTNISLALHTIAQSMDVTILALAQVHRIDDERSPRNSDLKESGQLEQDADIIMMLQLEKRSRPAGPRKLYITKNKEGELFQMLLTFDGRYQRFAKGGALDSAVADAKEMKQKFKPAAVQPGPIPGQFEMLPQDTDVPFRD